MARAWADGDHEPGLKLWARLAEQGVTMLATEATPVEVVIAFEALGKYAVPGPWVESAAFLPGPAGPGDRGHRHGRGSLPTCPTPSTPTSPTRSTSWRRRVHATVGAMHRSVDRTRRLSRSPARTRSSRDPRFAFDLGVLAASAQLLGLGERILADSVTYVKQRKQFGREIGSYQAIKHALADVRIALDFARPLVYGAALGTTASTHRRPRWRARDAAYLASRTGLQVHGAIGYTAEFDLSIWLTKVRALVGAWGTRRGTAASCSTPGSTASVRLMEFGLSEEQQELAATVRAVLAKRADSAAVRAAAESESGYDADLWKLLCEQIGVAALGIPEEYDGAGFSLFESLIALEEVGRSLAPSPLLRLAGRRRGAAGRRR